MANRLIILDNKTILKKTGHILGLSLLTFFLLLGAVSCQKAEEAGEEEGLSVKEGILEFEGTVKVAHGQYVYIPEASGFDIIVQGDISEGTEGLIGKEVKGQGEFSPDRPAILVATTIDIIDEGGEFQNVFTRTEDITFEDYMNMKERDEKFPALENLAYNKAEGWEDKERAKVYGKLERGEDKTIIVIQDDKDKQIGTVIVNSLDDFAEFYIKKLIRFDKFWFYLNIKDTVDWRTRRRTRELFHADVLFAGLY